MEHLNNTSNDTFIALDDCDNTPFSPQVHRKLLVNSKIELCPPILITSSHNIDRYVKVWVEKVLCDNFLVSGVIYNRITYTSTTKCGSQLYDVDKCYNTPFQATVYSSCNDKSLCPNDYESHASINSVLCSNFSCIKSLRNSCNFIAWNLSEKCLITITIQKKCKSPVC